MTKLIFGCSHGRDDAERATLPFIAANVAASAGQEAIVLLTIDGAWLATTGYAEDIHFQGMPQLRPLMEEFLDNGGAIWVCGACAKPRSITDEQLIKGAGSSAPPGSSRKSSTAPRTSPSPDPAARTMREPILMPATATPPLSSETRSDTSAGSRIDSG